MEFIGRLGKTVVWVWTVIVGGSALALMPFAPRGSGFLFFLGAVAGFAPLALMIWSGQSRKAGRIGANAAMAEAAGVVLGSGFEYSEGSTGIAINREARTLTLRDGADVKAYGYADVREWAGNHIKAGGVAFAGGGLAGGVSAIGAEARAHRDAKLASGFFVTVRDIVHPEWRVEMSDPKRQARWLEILRQELNEAPR